MGPRLIAVTLALLLVAASCSSDGEPQPAAQESTATPEATVPPDESSEQTATATPTPESAADPFDGTERFCEPTPAPDGDLAATARGVTADAIELGVIHLDLSLAASLGLVGDVGDPKAYWEALVGAVNDCGGINGRSLGLTFHDASLIDVDDQLRSCIAATEDTETFVVGNTTSLQGSAVLCVTEANATPLFSVGGYSAEFYERSDGRLYSTVAASDSRIAEAMIRDLDERGELDGRTIAVVAPDTPGILEVSEQDMAAVLEELGHDVTLEVIPCGGTLICTGGLPIVVERLVAGGVDVVFPTLNLAGLPLLVAEAASQGFEPTWYNSDVNGQSLGVSLDQIEAFGGADALASYDGTEIYTVGTGSRSRSTSPDPTEFEEMCLRTWDEAGGAELSDSDATTFYSVCSQLRMIVRGLYAAGPELTVDAATGAWQNLGMVQLNNGRLGSLGPGKEDAPDEFQVTVFDAECNCLLPSDDWKPLPQAS